MYQHLRLNSLRTCSTTSGWIEKKGIIINTENETTRKHSTITTRVGMPSLSMFRKITTMTVVSILNQMIASMASALRKNAMTLEARKVMQSMPST